mmetsp:Transcript_31271/g.51782  ORF Transcript_31271/g.51782 Transcript_31271/m.51782 type:complete len:282 (+) Transcript_31271:172-1017(+)
MEDGRSFLPASCSNMFVDVGANNGDSLNLWYKRETCAEFTGSGPAGVSKWPPHRPRKWPCAWMLPSYLSLAVRQTYCSELFEPNPVHWPALLRSMEQYATSGQRVRVHRKAFATIDDNVEFAIDNQTRNSEGSSMLLSKRLVSPKTGRPGQGPAMTHRIIAKATDGIAFLKRLERIAVTRVVLKLDVEGLEFELLRELLISGVLCRVVDDLFIEWHDGRFPWQEAGLPLKARDISLLYGWMLHYNVTQERNLVRGNVQRTPLAKAAARHSHHCKTVLFHWS